MRSDLAALSCWVRRRVSLFSHLIVRSGSSPAIEVKKMAVLLLYQKVSEDRLNIQNVALYIHPNAICIICCYGKYPK